MDEQEVRPTYRVLSTRTIALAALALVVVGIGVAIWLLVAYGRGTDADRNQLEAIKTAGTIVVGTGGAGALWLAARRQRTSEIALRQKDLDQIHAERVHALQERTANEARAHQERVAAASEADAAERRITELYTHAADQLGSDKAAVRLAGMYALERLAQNTPNQRQTIVNVLCAYLRMPYTPPSSRPLKVSGISDNQARPVTVDDASRASATGDVDRATQRKDDESVEQERQVRLTAQRILLLHLSAGNLDHPEDTFWEDVDIDLSGATLLEFDMQDCTINNGRFVEAQFKGDVSFDGAHFTGDVIFDWAHFSGNATFTEMELGDGDFANISFDRAYFSGDADFQHTHFLVDTTFNNARFRGAISLYGSHFWEDLSFDETSFKKPVKLNEARALMHPERNWGPARTLPNGWKLVKPSSVEEGKSGHAEGQWGRICPEGNG